VQVAGRKDAVLLRERLTKAKNASGAVVCDGCSGVFSGKYFNSHRKHCAREQCIEPRPVATSLFYGSFQVSDEFKEDVLSRFADDEVGRLCREDKTLVMIGSKLYQKMRNKKGKKRAVMLDMRRLGHIFLRFRDIVLQQSSHESTDDDSVLVLDMVRRQNFGILEQACSDYTSSTVDDAVKEKPALAQAVYYLLAKAARVVKVYHCLNEDDVRATEVTEFLDVLNFSRNNKIGGAVCEVSKNGRRKKLRRTDNFPQLADVERLRSYMQIKMGKLLGDESVRWTTARFVELRDLACGRVTLFNTRRGCEPARLHISDWTDACNEMPPDRERAPSVTEEEWELVGKSFVMHQTGCGVNHSVPVLVPKDTVPALKKLADADARRACGVVSNNSYLFPSADASESHVGGWNALNRICFKAGVESSKITATEVRHLASTMYTSLELPESKRSAFCSHMGHSKAVCKNLNRAPLSDREELQAQQPRKCLF